MSDDLEEQFMRLGDAIAHRHTGWRERFELFWNSEIHSGWKKYLGVAVVHAIVKGNNPEEYTWAIGTLKEVLALEEDLDVIRSASIATLVNLLMFVGEDEEAMQWYGKLKELVNSNNPTLSDPARMMNGTLRQRYPGLE